jgi:hypothetical protein
MIPKEDRGRGPGYAGLVNSLSAFLREREFVRRGTSFYRNEAETWLIVNLQKSRDSRQDLVLFAINIGVASKRVWRALNAGQDPGLPHVSEAHWRKRVSPSPRRGPYDEWYRLQQEDDIPMLLDRLISLLEESLREMMSYSTDDALRRLWESGRGPGLTEKQLRDNLSVLTVGADPK